jgi:hypothetical protein
MAFTEAFYLKKLTGQGGFTPQPAIFVILSIFSTNAPSKKPSNYSSSDFRKSSLLYSLSSRSFKYLREILASSFSTSGDRSK